MIRAIAPLVSLLRGEAAAVESYRRAVARVRDREARDELAQALAAHQRRAGALRARIDALGGDPSAAPTRLEAALAFLEDAVLRVSDRLAVALLASEESRVLLRYREELARLDPQSRALVADRLLPAQERTYSAVASLRSAMLH